MNTPTTRIILLGYNGRMGKTVINLARERKDTKVVAGVDIKHDGGVYAMPTYSYIDDCEAEADVIVDFSSPADAVPSNLRYASARGLPIVVCTTGLSAETDRLIEELAHKIAIFRSANMSLGVNLLAEMMSKYARILSDAGFDIEIVEKHHSQKLDAPSGTALLLADEINRALEGELHYVNDRSTVRQVRGKKELGIHAVRGGTVMGEHEVIFAGNNEMLEFRHSITSREVFAEGALAAARFMKGRTAGLYTMRDIIS